MRLYIIKPKIYKKKWLGSSTSFCWMCRVIRSNCIWPWMLHIFLCICPFVYKKVHKITTKHYFVNWQQNYLFTTAINSTVCLDLLLNQTDAILLTHLSHLSQLMAFKKIRTNVCSRFIPQIIKAMSHLWTSWFLNSN